MVILYFLQIVMREMKLSFSEFSLKDYSSIYSTMFVNSHWIRRCKGFFLQINKRMVQKDTRKQSTRCACQSILSNSILKITCGWAHIQYGSRIYRKKKIIIIFAGMKKALNLEKGHLRASIGQTATWLPLLKCVFWDFQGK